MSHGGDGVPAHTRHSVNTCRIRLDPGEGNKKKKKRKQISGYQWGEGKEEGEVKGVGLTDTDYYVEN